MIKEKGRAPISADQQDRLTVFSPDSLAGNRGS